MGTPAIIVDCELIDKPREVSCRSEIARLRDAVSNLIHANEANEVFLRQRVHELESELETMRRKNAELEGKLETQREIARSLIPKPPHPFLGPAPKIVHDCIDTIR